MPQTARALCVAALLGLLPLPAPAAEQGQGAAQLELRVGMQVRREVPGLERVAVSHPAIADVSTEGAATVVVKGVSPGRTKVVAWTARGPQAWDVVVR